MSRTGAAGPPESREPLLAEFRISSRGELSSLQVQGQAAGAAPLPLRAMAATADLAAAALGVSLPIVAASALVGSWPTPLGLAWAAAFALTLSWASTVGALFLFGRTAGMALAGLSIRPDAGGRRPTAGQAARRWAGTALTAAALGLPLLWTMDNTEARTLADRFSGRPLMEDE